MGTFAAIAVLFFPVIVPAGAPRHRTVASPQPAPPERWAESLDEQYESEDVSPDATVVFNRPVDEPVQILPGRLHVLTGQGSGEDLRFLAS